MNIFAISSAAAFLVSVLLGLLALIKGHKTSIKNAFVAVAFLAGTWCLFPLIASLDMPYPVLLRLVKFIYISAIFTGPAFLQFGLSIAEVNNKGFEKTFVRLSYVTAFLLIPFIFTDLFIKGFLRFLPAFILVPGPLYPLLILFFCSTCSLSFYKMLVLFSSAKGSKRNQLKYVFIAYFIGFLSAVVHFGSAYGLREVFPHDILIVVCMGLLFYVVSQYKLMDIRLAIGKVVIFVSIYSVAVIIPFLIYSFTGKLMLGWAIFALLCAVAPYIIAALENRFRHVIYMEEFARRHLLRLTAKTAAKMDRMDELADWTTKSLCDLLNVSQAYLFIHDAGKEKYISYSGYPSTVPIGLIGFPELSSIIEASKEGFMIFNKKKEDEDRLQNMFGREDLYKLRQMNRQVNEALIEELDEIEDNMTQLGAELAFMIKFEEHLEGLLFLGPKREQHIYISEDIETLMDFCDGIAAAIRHIRAYEELHETQARLVQEEKWATLGRLGTSTKHELGSPMSIIKMALEMLFYKMRKPENRRKPIEEYERELRVIHQQAERSINTLNIIHQLPKQVQEGMVGLKLDDIVDKSFELSRFQTYWENLSDTPVERRYSADLPLIKGNIVHLQGVFLNLIINSYQAMEGLDHMHRKIIIEAKRDDLQSSMIEIKFSDTGSGIPHRDLDKVFDFRYTTKKRGSGLGLFVSKYFIEKIHEGTIEVIENEGKGACFRICLPMWRSKKK